MTTRLRVWYSKGRRILRETRMATYLLEYNDERGDIVDRDIACSRLCAQDSLRERDLLDDPDVEWFEYHCYESDSDTFCVSCGVLITLGEPRFTDDGDRCHRCPPTLIGLGRTDSREHCHECGGVVQVPT